MNKNKADNDSELVERLLSGDQEAMKDVFRFYYLRLLHFTIQAIGNKEDAKDLVQEALFNFWINVSEKKVSPESIQRYLYRMVRNRCINYLNKKKRQEEADGTVIELFYTASEQRIDQLKVKEEFYQRVADNFNNLTSAQAQVVRKMFFEGLSVQEIADQMQTTSNNVRNHKARAIERLRQVIDKDLFLSFLLFVKLFSNFL